MICDKCREDTGKYHVTSGDGEVLCYDCAKRKKRRPSKVVKTTDPFVELCRVLMKLRRRDDPFSEVIAEDSGGKRCYTNSQVMLSDADSMPDTPKTIHVNTMKAEDVRYPSVEYVLSKLSVGTSGIFIPEDFYRYLSAFDTSHIGRTEVDISSWGIVVRDIRDPSEMELHYREADVSNMPRHPDETTAYSRLFDGAYIATLKPGWIKIGPAQNSVCLFGESYAPGAKGRKYILVMPVVYEYSTGTEVT